MHNITAIVQGKNIFTKLYLIRTYHQISVESQNILNATITNFELFVFLRAPFALRNAAQSFQKFIDNTLHGLNLIYAYSDDVLIARTSMEEHIQQLHLVFERFHKFGVVRNPVKYEFGKQKVIFLGYHICSAGISPSPAKFTITRT